MDLSVVKLRRCCRIFLFVELNFGAFLRFGVQTRLGV